MTANIVDDIAQRIRIVDGGNTMPAVDLGWEIGTWLTSDRPHLYAIDVMRFVERTNRDKTMGAGALAELIVAEFNLNGE